MRRFRLEGLHYLLLALSVLWVMLGAPILPEEWMMLPSVLLQRAQQLPRRMQLLLTYWLQ